MNFRCLAPAVQNRCLAPAVHKPVPGTRSSREPSRARLSSGLRCRAASRSRPPSQVCLAGKRFRPRDAGACSLARSPSAPWRRPGSGGLSRPTAWDAYSRIARSSPTSLGGRPRAVCPSFAAVPRGPHRSHAPSSARPRVADREHRRDDIRGATSTPLTRTGLVEVEAEPVRVFSTLMKSLPRASLNVSRRHATAPSTTSSCSTLTHSTGPIPSREVVKTGLENGSVS